MKMTTDTRQLFDRLTSRKEEWEDMKARDWATLHESQQAALKAMPVLEVPAGCSSFDRNPAFAADPIEKVIRRGSGTYYVNSEGYNYARYGFRIIGWPAAV